MNGRSSAVTSTILSGLIIAGTGWLTARGLARSPAPSAAEQAFAIRAYAINRFGLAAAHLPWLGGRTAALQIAGFQTLSGGLGRIGDAVASAREAMVAAAVLTSGALAFAARRLGLSAPATAAALALFGMPPAMVLLHRTADPANLAVLWACLALSLATAPAARGSGRTTTPIGAFCCAGVAVLTSPLVLVGLVPMLTAYAWWSGSGRVVGAQRLLVAAAGATGWAAVVALLATGWLPPDGRSPATGPSLAAVDLALLAVAAASAVMALRVLYLRPVAVGLIGITVAAVFAPAARGPLAILGVPLAALLVPAVADTVAPPARFLPLVVGLRRAAAGAAGVLLLGATATSWAAPRQPAETPSRADDATAKARDWLLANLPGQPRLAVDDAVWFALVRAGYPAQQLSAGPRVGPGAGWPGGWTAAQFVVGGDDALLGPDDDNDLVRQARAHSAVVARFGEAGQVTVRRVLAGPAALNLRADTAALAQAAAMLLGSPNLWVDPDAVAPLRDGRVDDRVVALLAALTNEHDMEVSAFPSVPGEVPSATRHLVVFTALDGRPLAPGSAAAATLEQWMLAQRPPLRPASTTPTTVKGRPGLLVRYDASQIAPSR